MIIIAILNGYVIIIIVGGLDQKNQDAFAQDIKAKLDLFGATPEHTFPNFTTWFGVTSTILTILLFCIYLGMTVNDFITEPPEVIKQGDNSIDNVSFPVPKYTGIVLEYKLDDGSKVKLNATNKDRYFRIQAAHITIREQDKLPRVKIPLNLTDCIYTNGLQMICVSENLPEHIKLMGKYQSPKYQYVKIEVRSCTDELDATEDDPDFKCAAKEEIDSIIKREVKIGINMGLQDFDVNLYHNRKGKSVTVNWASERYFILPSQHTLVEAYLLGRVISFEERLMGSPPMPQKSVSILSFQRMETRARPNYVTNDHFTVYVRLSATLQQEEIQYWVRNILDLLGMLGGFLSFLSVIGLVAKKHNHNRWKNSYNKKSQKLTSAMMLDINRDLELPLDTRLLDKDNFNSQGRLIITAEEFAIPTSIHGELRSFAVAEHVKKCKAAGTLITWYNRRKTKKSVV